MSVIRKANRKRKRSSLELAVHAWLKEDGIAFKIEKAIGRCHVDVFIEPRTIIELQGCFWHGCLICNRQLTHAQKIAQIKDARRFAYFRNRGFDVIAIWECEVGREPERVRAILRALAGKKGE
jgi:G:T-mismatch repair DNA endonuclease (very short patch repair protein)